MYKKGFTLIEIMVVMAIVAVLAVMIIGAITLTRRAAAETTNRSNSKTIQASFEAKFANKKAYCGYVGGPVCGTTYSVRAIAPLMGLVAANWKTSCAGNCGTASACDDGGQITNLDIGTYTITAATWNCGGLLANDVYRIQ